MFTKYSLPKTNEISLSNRIQSFSYTKLDQELSLMHSHSLLEVIVPCTNFCTLTLINKSIRMKCGNLYIVSPHIMHTETKFDHKSSAIYYAVKLKGQLLTDDVESPVIELQFEEKNAELKSYLDFAKTHFNDGNTELAMIDLQGFDLVFQQILCNNSHTMSPINSPSISSLVSEAVHYISSNYGSSINFEELANKFNVSQNTLISKFKNDLGISPKKYLIQMRMDAATYLLRTSDFSITQIASMCGYDLPAHFSYVFKNHHGMSPKKYKLNTSIS